MQQRKQRWRAEEAILTWLAVSTFTLEQSLDAARLCRLRGHSCCFFFFLSYIIILLIESSHLVLWRSGGARVSGSWSLPWIFIPLVTVQLHLPFALQVAGIAAVWWTQSNPVRNKNNQKRRKKSVNRCRILASLKWRRWLKSNKLVDQRRVIFVTTKRLHLPVILW